MINESISNGIKISQDVFDDMYTNQSFTKKFLVTMGWRMKVNGTKDEPIASYAIKNILSVDVPKILYKEVINQKDNGGVVWKIVFALGHLVFEMVGHNMQITLEIGTTSKVFSIIRPYNADITWPTEWPIEAEGNLDSIKAR